MYYKAEEKNLKKSEESKKVVNREKFTAHKNENHVEHERHQLLNDGSPKGSNPFNEAWNSRKGFGVLGEFWICSL